MNKIKISHWSEIPTYFTGVAEYADGYKEWYLNNVCYKQIFLGDNVILDSYQGEYNLIWFKLLGKYKVFEYPDIPGLIIK